LDIARPLLEPLTGRELEVLRLVAAGFSNREIAAELVVAVSTVKWYINILFSKLEVKSRTLAVARARSLRLIAP
jgi:LuxR family maltose regulon positive regulatory protein